MTTNALFLPMACHLLWTGGLYALLTVFRAPSVWNVGVKADGSNPWGEIEPKLSANLSNQFEWPIFFHIICVLIIATGSEINAVHWVLAWAFVAGRVIHSGVQIFTTNIRLRGIVFTINFLAVFGLWGVFFLQG